MPTTISGSSGVTYPSGGLANTAGAGVGTTDTQTLTNKTLTTPNIDSAQFATVSGTAPIYPCRAWVNFNGTGTVAIRASGNVSSITDGGTGIYTVNFTTAISDANYTTVGSADRTSGTRQMFVTIGNGTGVITTSSVGLNTLNDGTLLTDAAYIGVSIFR